MKFTLSWLKEHLDTDADIKEIGETLTRIGLEVEEITDPRAGLKEFVTARIDSVENHPDADKLPTDEPLSRYTGGNSKVGLLGPDGVPVTQPLYHHIKAVNANVFRCFYTDPYSDTSLSVLINTKGQVINP